MVMMKCFATDGWAFWRKSTQFSIWFYRLFKQLHTFADQNLLEISHFRGTSRGLYPAQKISKADNYNEHHFCLSFLNITYKIIEMVVGSSHYTWCQDRIYD